MDLFLLLNSKINFYSEQGIDYEVNMLLKEHKHYLKEYNLKKEDDVYIIYATLYDINNADEFIDLFVKFIRYKDFYTLYREKWGIGFFYQFITAFKNEEILTGFGCKFYLRGI